MNIIYFFSCFPVFSGNLTRVPVYGYYRDVVGKLLSQCNGFWNEGSALNVCRDIFLKQEAVPQALAKIFPGIPLVFIDEKPDGKIRIFNFFEQPWVSGMTNEKQNFDLNVSGFSSKNVSFGGSPDKSPEDFQKQVFNEANPFVFPVQPSLPEKISEYWIGKLEAELRSRKYSPRTQNSYIFYNRLLCRTVQKTPEQIRSDDVKEFLAGMEKNNDYSSSSLNLALSAIKFFFKNVFMNENICEQYRPRKDKNLPMVLSKEEISKVLSMENNPKHRLLLMLVYSSGLRVSEVVALKKEHIDLSRKVIYIKLGKGRKDRNTLLSEKAANFIGEYYNFYNIQKWIFPGQPPTKPLTIRSAQHIFEKAVRRAGITKRITIHCLRHTFATHLLEGGTDIRYIQSLLGHANIRTTERYTHIAKRSILNIKSPLDTIP